MGIGTGLGVAGIASSTIGAVASSKAAGAQSNAAKSAAQLQSEEAANSLAFQQKEFNAQQANEAPFIQQGQGAVNMLGNALGVTPGPPLQQVSVGGQPPVPGVSTPNASPASNAIASTPQQLSANNPYAAAAQANGQPTANASQPTATGPELGRESLGQISAQQQAATGAPSADSVPTNIGGVNYNLPTGGGTGTGDLLQPWTPQFQAPTAEQAAQTPGYQFALGQGQQAVNNSAAARGGLLSGGNVKALDQYSQGLADTNYQQVYNNAMGQYQQGYNQFQNNQANTYNRLAGLAGTGQTAATNLGSLGQSAASNVGSINSNAGAQIGQNLNNAGAATASGYVGTANALSGGINNTLQSLQLQQLLNQYKNQQTSPMDAGGELPA